MNQTTATDPMLWLLIPVLFLLTATAMFFFVGQLLAAIGGWRALAAHYRASEEPFGERFSWCSSRMGVVNYNNCLNLVASRSNLHLSIFPLLRSGHPALLLPWSEITVTPSSGFLGPYLDLVARRAPGVRLRLRRTFAEKVLRAAGQPIPG
jgi:hypothetical protein